MKPRLDWSAYTNTGMADAFGDPFGAAAQPPPTESDAGVVAALALCKGKRVCLDAGAAGVMCPSFRATGDARHSPKGRIEAFSAWLTHAREGRAKLPDAGLDAAMALCLSCKGCKRECPNGVDVALLRAEYLAQRHALQGVPWRTRLLAAASGAWAQRRSVAALVRWRNRLPWLARLGEHWLGIDRSRRLPVPLARPPRTAAPTPAVAEPAVGEVALLVDSFARGFEHGPVEAALAVLRAAGYRVHVLEPAADDGTPARPLCCGRSQLSLGLVDEARIEARRMLAALAPAIATRMPVIGLEPSCLYMLKDEYFSLGLGAEVGRLAGQVFLFEEFLAREHAAGRLRLALKPLDLPPAVVHGHCHQKAFGAMPAVRTVLGLIPGLEFAVVESGCCGMAGAFGLQAENRGLSHALAEAALLPAVRAAAPEAPVVADGFSCRHQIRDGSGRRPIHVAELLQRALA